MSDVEERSRQLYAEGAAGLATAWDDGAGLIRHETEFGVFHDARGSLAYASLLFDAGDAESIRRAHRIIAHVAGMQELRQRDAHYGNFRWFLEDACVTDLNAVEFVLDALNALVREHPRALDSEATALIRRMMLLGLAEIDRLDVHPSYTNIALSDIANSVLGGEWLGEPRFVERGRRRLTEWLAFTMASGAPHEYNSPTYAAVDIGRMAALAEHAEDAEIALKARVAEERLWLHVATHYHPQLAQIAGPHARAYRDGWTGAGGYLKLMLWKLLGDDALRATTPYFPKGREEGHTGIARATPHCPGYVREMLREKRVAYQTLETPDVVSRADIATYMTASYALGTASRSWDVGAIGEPWPQPSSLLLHFAKDEPPGYGVLFSRYVVNDKGPGAVMHESNRNAEDFWEEGQFVGAQHRNQAIIAYGLRPRTRPAHSYKLSLRILGVDDRAEIWAGERRVESLPAQIAPRTPVVVGVGGVHIALIPLEPTDMGSDAPIELSREGDLLTLDVYNYRGPPKTFWEHRSQSGPFYKGNVRNAVIVEVAERDEYADAAAFRAHVAAARVDDTTDASRRRTVAYACDGGSLAMTYSLVDMSVHERGFDGELYESPPSRAGALDGSGWQFASSRGGDIAIGEATLTAHGAACWLSAHAERGRYVAVKTSDMRAPVALDAPGVRVECDAIGFARMDVDLPQSVARIDACGDVDRVRVVGAASMRVLVNGQERPS